jgi:hypothetical protein
MLIQGGMVIGGVLVLKQRIEYIKKEKPQFEQELIETTFLGALASLFTTPFSHLLESGKKADYISCWADYQVKDHKLNYKCCMKCYSLI